GSAPNEAGARAVAASAAQRSAGVDNRAGRSGFATGVAGRGIANLRVCSRNLGDSLEAVVDYTSQEGLGRGGRAGDVGPRGGAPPGGAPAPPLASPICVLRRDAAQLAPRWTAGASCPILGGHPRRGTIMTIPLVALLTALSTTPATLDFANGK